VIAVVEDFQKIAAQLIGEHGKAEVIDEEHVEHGELPQETGAALQDVSAGEFQGPMTSTLKVF